MSGDGQGAYRIAAATKAEIETAKELEDLGWSVTRFGQGLLPESFREMLKKFRWRALPTLLRWMPDLLMAKLFNDIAVCFLVDVKVDTGKTGNYAIEKNALATAQAYQNSLNIPAVFMFHPGLRILTPKMVELSCWDGPPPMFGSGTPYVLIDKSHSISLDDAVVGFLSLPA